MNTKRAVTIGSIVFIVLCICFWPTEVTTYSQKTSFRRGFITESSGQVRILDLFGYAMLSGAIGAVSGFSGRKKE